DCLALTRRSSERSPGFAGVSPTLMNVIPDGPQDQARNLWTPAIPNIREVVGSRRCPRPGTPSYFGFLRRHFRGRWRLVVPLLVFVVQANPGHLVGSALVATLGHQVEPVIGAVQHVEAPRVA